MTADMTAILRFFDSNRRYLPVLVHQGSVRPLPPAFLLFVIILSKDHTWFEELNHCHQHIVTKILIVIIRTLSTHHHHYIIIMTTPFSQTLHFNIISTIYLLIPTPRMDLAYFSILVGLFVRNKRAFLGNISNVQSICCLFSSHGAQH